MTVDELEQIKQIQCGDQQRLERFLTEKKPLVNLACRPYFFKGGDESDLAEEATIGLVSAVMTFDSSKNDNFDGYAVTLMRRRIINAVKSSNRLKHSVLNDSEPLTVAVGEDGAEFERAAVSEDPIDRYLTEESVERFYQSAKRVLTEGEYRVLELFLEGYSYREIAEKTGASAKDVDNTIYRVKKKIKRSRGLFYDDEQNDEA